MDYYSALKDFAGPVATLCAAFAATFVTVRLANGQRAIALSQANTAAESLRTAEHKLVMDLFDKRWELVSDVRNVLNEVQRNGVVSQEDKINFYRAIQRSEFLFGPDVTDRLNGILKVLLKHHGAQRGVASEDKATRTKAADIQYDEFAKLIDMSNTFDALIKPYMVMHHKVPPERAC